MLLKKLISEFIGTFILVFFGCGAAVLAFDTGNSSGFSSFELMMYNAATTIGVALVFGLAVVACIYIFGDISGCHMNPAVSLSMLLCGKITLQDFFAYITAQIAGAFAGCGLIYLINIKFAIVSTENLTYGANTISGTTLGSLIIEAVLTFVFILTILGVTANTKNSSVNGLVIGLSLTLVHLIGIPLTGTSVNPARSIAPAVLAGGAALENLWVFITAPFAGAAFAAILFKYLKNNKE